jgi:vacuolar protein sorting-associated protein 35
MERESESSNLDIHSSDMSDSKVDRESPADKQKRVVEKSQGLINRWTFQMNRALDLGDVDEVFLHAAKVILPLSKLQLSPQSYNVLDHVVSTNLIGLSVTIADTTRLSNREITEQYEKVQYDRGALKRLCLMVTRGPELATRRVARMKDVIEDLSEVLKQAQDPLHALFLRHFLLSVFRQHMPESSHHEVDRSLKFLLQNFAQMNHIWLRIADTSQSAERHSLSVLAR